MTAKRPHLVQGVVRVFGLTGEEDPHHRTTHRLREGVGVVKGVAI